MDENESQVHGERVPIDFSGRIEVPLEDIAQEAERMGNHHAAAQMRGELASRLSESAIRRAQERRVAQARQGDEVQIDLVHRQIVQMGDGDQVEDEIDPSFVTQELSREDILRQIDAAVASGKMDEEMAKQARIMWGDH